MINITSSSTSTSNANGKRPRSPTSPPEDPHTKLAVKLLTDRNPLTEYFNKNCSTVPTPNTSNLYKKPKALMTPDQYKKEANSILDQLTENETVDKIKEYLSKSTAKNTKSIVTHVTYLIKQEIQQCSEKQVSSWEKLESFFRNPFSASAKELPISDISATLRGSSSSSSSSSIISRPGSIISHAPSNSSLSSSIPYFNPSSKHYEYLEFGLQEFEIWKFKKCPPLSLDIQKASAQELQKYQPNPPIFENHLYALKLSECLEKTPEVFYELLENYLLLENPNLKNISEYSISLKEFLQTISIKDHEKFKNLMRKHVILRDFYFHKNCQDNIGISYFYNRMKIEEKQTIIIKHGSLFQFIKSGFDGSKIEINETRTPFYKASVIEEYLNGQPNNEEISNPEFQNAIRSFLNSICKGSNNEHKVFKMLIANHPTLFSLYFNPESLPLSSLPTSLPTLGMEYLQEATKFLQKTGNK